MYEYDYDKVTLNLEEKYKLFITKRKKKTTEKFLGDSKNYLLGIRFIKANYSGQRNEIGEQIPDGTYSVTWYYGRYLIWKRNKAFYGMLSMFCLTPLLSCLSFLFLSNILDILIKKITH